MDNTSFSPNTIVVSLLGNEWGDFWFTSLMLNILGYATVIIPGFILVKSLRNSVLLDKPGFVFTLLRLFVRGNGGRQTLEGDSEPDSTSPTSSPKHERPLREKALLLAAYVVGLQLFYLTWGVMQERIMTVAYGESLNNPGVTFKDSQFLVFMNRILALCIALVTLRVMPQPTHTTPFYKYSYCSFSNIMSTWCQYEALKFVTFPTQVLFKTCKVIPVMIMGWFVSRKKYTLHDYLEAICISLGVAIFLLNTQNSHKGQSSNSLSGFIILGGYITFDSFTSNWQSQLFKKNKVSSLQMMAGVNFFSVILTLTTLVQQGSFWHSFAFMVRFPYFCLHVLLLSFCSAAGQLFIYATISEFGPVVFTIVMTLRQALAILLSCIIYSHPVTPLAMLGIAIVFLSILLKRYFNCRKTRAIKKLQASSDNEV